MHVPRSPSPARQEEPLTVRGLHDALDGVGRDADGARLLLNKLNQLERANWDCAICMSTLQLVMKGKRSSFSRHANASALSNAAGSLGYAVWAVPVTTDTRSLAPLEMHVKTAPMRPSSSLGFAIAVADTSPAASDA